MIISTINYKGGVGKTTSCCNLAGASFERGHRTLILDLDPQGSASEYFGLAEDAGATLFDWFRRDAALSDITVRVRGDTSRGPVLDVCRADERLTKIQNVLYSRNAGAFMSAAFRDAPTATFLRRYDYVFLDCPPSIGALSDNAIRASDIVLMVLACQFMSLTGLRRLTNMLRRAGDDGFTPHWFILPTLYRATEIESSLVRAKVIERVGAYPEGRMLMPIRKHAAFGQAFKMHQTIFEFDDSHPGAEQVADVFQQIVHAAGALATTESAATKSAEGSSPPVA